LNNFENSKPSLKLKEQRYNITDITMIEKRATEFMQSRESIYTLRYNEKQAKSEDYRDII